MSGFVHPERQREHARQDARQRFIDRKHGMGKVEDEQQRGAEDGGQRPKWKVEGERQRGSRWGPQQTSGGSGAAKKEEKEPEESRTGRPSDEATAARRGSNSSGAFVHPDRLRQVGRGTANGEIANRDSGEWQPRKDRAQHSTYDATRDSNRHPPTIASPLSQPHDRQWRRPPSPGHPPTNSSWDATKPSANSETTRLSPSATASSSSATSPSRPPPDDDDPTAVDREWYNQDEENPVASDDVAHAFPAVDAADGGMRRQARKLTARAQQVTRDNAAWEESRMFQSGVVTATSVDTDHAGAETERKVQLVVHELKPPFLDGRTVYTRQEAMVSVVKDASSDMAMIARKGSALLASVRERADRNRMKDKFWEVAGNRIGNVMGVKQQESEEERQERQREEGEQQREGEGGTVDYRQASQFASHLQDKTAAQSEFSASNSVAAQRQYLPIYTCKDELMRVIRDNPVVIIVGETGSGKTTQLTQYLLEEGYGKLGVIGCTQPRRVAAMSVAKRVSEEFGCELGQEVGYNIRFEDVTSAATVIQYMTEGVLLRESLTQPDLDKYSCVVMDEAHERALNTDVLLGLMKKIVARRRDLHLIVTSATMDADRFSHFFGSAPIFRIPGRTFPVEVLYSKTPVEDYLDGAVKQIVTVHLSFPPGDILVFMNGQEDIEACCVEVAERLEKLGGEIPPIAILPLYSQLPADLQAKIFQPAPPGTRKVIVSTNLAETSITVDGIRYVIDTGYSKLKVYNPKIGMDSLAVTPIARANADQRAGRAGRTGPGVCFRLYTEVQYNGEMLANAVPEIQRTNLSHVVLLIKSLGVTDMLQFDFLDPPPQETILSSMYQLWVLQALDNTGQLTAMGRRMVEFPLDPPLSKMLLSAQQLQCVSEMCVVVAMLSIPNVFFRPADRAAESDAAREKFFVAESDHLTLLHVFQQWALSGYSSEWCKRHYLHVKALKKVREVQSQLHDILKTLGVPLSSSGDFDAMRRCIASAFFHQSAHLKGIDSYVNCRTQLPCHLHPSSALSSAGYVSEYVVYNELVLTSKEYMRTVTVVEAEWLAEYGSMWFSVRESYRSRMERKAKEKAERAGMAREMEEKEEREREEAEKEDERRRMEVMSRKKKGVLEVGESESREERRKKRPKMIGL